MECREDGKVRPRPGRRRQPQAFREGDRGIPRPVRDQETRADAGNRGERRFDLPGGGKRMVMPAKGVRSTVVNGTVTWADGQTADAAVGTVLRS